MSRKETAMITQFIENFFGILKSEFLYTQEFDSVEHF
ncbi:IS3 family transposase [Brevibacillus sp. 7WMA2]|nr:IS3 family transposase [Brevibacillus sp. 7WMA2]